VLRLNCHSHRKRKQLRSTNNTNVHPAVGSSDSNVGNDSNGGSDSGNGSVGGSGGNGSEGCVNDASCSSSQRLGSAVRSLWKLQSSDEGNLRIMVLRTCQDRGNNGQQ
jgi:hypothetical protein